jgi:hypothetical protein
MNTLTARQQFAIAYRKERESNNPANDGYSKTYYSREYSNLPYCITQAAYSIICLRSRGPDTRDVHERLACIRSKRAWMELFSHA